MESSTVKKKTLAQARPLCELLPTLGGLFSKDVQQTFTDKKKPHSTRVQTLTADKVLKPMSYNDLRAHLLAIKPQSPKGSQPSASSRKKEWVSSIKVDYKTVSHTANGQLRNHPVRKVLNFQAPQLPKPKPPPRMTQYNPRMTQYNPRMTQYNPRMTQHNPRITQFDTETPKFPKPDSRPKKSVYSQAKNSNNVRISGICKIPETPLEAKPHPSKQITVANKENNPFQVRQSIYKAKEKQPALPTPVPKNPRKVAIDTPADSSWKSNDASFIQKEKEIQDQLRATANHEKVPEKQIVSTPSSTPFKDYRSIQEYFNNSSEVENSAVYNDNTIMCFDKPTGPNNSKREESVMVSLCDLFNKATVDAEKVDADLNTLLEMKIQAESMIRQVDTGIRILNNIKQSQVESLKRVNKLIDEKKNGKTDNEMEITLVGQPAPDILVTSPKDPSPIISRPCSVIQSHCSFKSHTAIKSPSYKVPKKNGCLRKKLVYKSMPNVSTVQTPVKDINGQALNVYMELKENMNFLSTPSVDRAGVMPDTPMVTSHNLQKQLDKLYNGS